MLHGEKPMLWGSVHRSSHHESVEHRKGSICVRTCCAKQGSLPGTLVLAMELLRGTLST
jgi:hypothetical protein